MSTELSDLTVNQTTAVQFFGGLDLGICLQLTQPGGHIFLTVEEAMTLGQSLQQWAQEKLQAQHRI